VTMHHPLSLLAVSAALAIATANGIIAILIG
jgi:hypothetical protein